MSNIRLIPKLISEQESLATASSYYDISNRPFYAWNGTYIGASNIFWTSITGVTPPHWISCDLINLKYIVQYTIFTRSDAIERSPKSWTVSISNTGLFSGEQTIIDSQSNVTNWNIPSRLSNTYMCSNPTVGRYIRFTITEMNGSGTLCNIADIDLYEDYNHLNIYSISPSFVTEVKDKCYGTLSTADNSSIDSSFIAWNSMKDLMDKSVNSGSTLYNNTIVSTYSLSYTSNRSYSGGVLAPNGDIHFIPYGATVGQKIDLSGIVSTYSILSNGYIGGVLSSNGDIHFIPDGSEVGQKISSYGIVSTYSLINTVNGYSGGILAPNGDIHFVPYYANVGQKVLIDSAVSTYSLEYTSDSSYSGGVLAPNGDIHFIPNSAIVGQKINSSGIVSTYSLEYTNGAGAYSGGVLAPNGDIHFIPYFANSGQKISSTGIVSTYSILSSGYNGGVLAPNGDIHFIPYGATVGQKISSNGIVSTYSLVYTIAGAYVGGILAPSGDIHFIPYKTDIGQTISTLSALPFDRTLCLSPYLNKF